jgi:hypothetical protein
MDIRIEQLKVEIADLEAQVKPLMRRLEDLRAAKREAESRRFIEINGIVAKDVQMSSDAEAPYFGHISGFIQWLRAHSNKNWVEWNGRIYRMSDLLNNRYSETPALADHLAK